jgi:hypothetical protein
MKQNSEWRHKKKKKNSSEKWKEFWGGKNKFK